MFFSRSNSAARRELARQSIRGSVTSPRASQRFFARMALSPIQSPILCPACRCRARPRRPAPPSASATELGALYGGESSLRRRRAPRRLLPCALAVRGHARRGRRGAPVTGVGPALCKRRADDWRGRRAGCGGRRRHVLPPAGAAAGRGRGVAS
jgi:hypothetical protein